MILISKTHWTLYIKFQLLLNATRMGMQKLLYTRQINIYKYCNTHITYFRILHIQYQRRRIRGAEWNFPFNIEKFCFLFSMAKLHFLPGIEKLRFLAASENVLQCLFVRMHCASSAIDSSVHQARMHPTDNVLYMQKYSCYRDALQSMYIT